MTDRQRRSRVRVGVATLVLFASIAVQSLRAASAGVLMQGFYWDLPSPAAGTSTAPWWWDNLAGKANEMRLAGFTAVWIPPVLKGAAGGYSMGYDPYDDYDLGSKNQMYTLPTRFGTREQLQRCVAMLRANGLDVYVDMVLNHLSGDSGNYSFLHPDAYGNWGQGRFQKGTYDFHPNVPQDPDVPNEDSSFGRDLAPINGAGGYINAGLKQSGDWLVKALDVQGFRLDYVKGISTDFLLPYLNYGAMAGKFAVGEYWDSNRDTVIYWIQTSMQNRSSAFDFPLREELKNMCNGGGYYDMTRLVHAGLAGINPGGAVTFVENHDTDKDYPITQKKLLAYAYIPYALILLRREGYPCVFYADYYGAEYENCRSGAPPVKMYSHRFLIDRFLKARREYGYGDQYDYFDHPNTIGWVRTGNAAHPGAMAVVMSNGGDGNKWMNTFKPNATFTDVTGHCNVKIQTNGEGWGNFLCRAGKVSVWTQD